MTERFEPIAVVGRGCIVPGCDSPAALWSTVAQGLCQIGDPPAADWRVDMARVTSPEPGRYRPDQAWSVRGGYVSNLAVRIDPAVELGPDLVEQLDPVFRWTLHAAGQALNGVKRVAAERGGLVLGNLSYPTRLLGRMVERQWMEHAAGVRPGPKVHPLNRYMSGSPAMLAARAFGLRGGSLALDAACASGLYATKIACDRLQARRADLMLAGSVNAADQLFLHVGFSALNALSLSGHSRPFNAKADGLVPAEGAAFLVLKRLDDALSEGDHIFGVIRGVGLSNDGRSGGFLSPARQGQARAMRAALEQSGLAADRIQYIECHATGTPVGDATEIASLLDVYGRTAIALGSLKANLGHLITASSIAGIIKTLSAIEHETLPPTPGVKPLSAALEETAFVVPQIAAPWEPHNGQRTAAISGFGFGGNNAHLILQQHLEVAPARRRQKAVSRPPAPVAVVGLGLRTGRDADAVAFGRRILGGQAGAPAFEADVLALAARQLTFPPAELRKALGQQLVLLEVARHALQTVAELDPARTGVFIGMQTDPRVCRHAVRIRWPDLMQEAGKAGQGTGPAATDVVSEALDSAAVIGKMPNITANRLSNQMNLHGPSFAVSREELSGDAALELAVTALGRGEIDSALVGAVDLSREPLHEQAAQALLDGLGAQAADAAVMLVVKTMERALADGDQILGLISQADADGAVDLCNTPDSPIAVGLGHAHAASGLLHLALGLQMLGARTRLDADGEAQPLLAGARAGLTVGNTSFQGERAIWRLETTASTPPLRIRPALHMRRYAGAERESLLAAVMTDQPGGEGKCRLAIVGTAEELATLREQAVQGLISQPTRDAWSIDGVNFRARPLSGEMAFVFTGAAAAYPGMGRDLLLAMPDLALRLDRRLPGAPSVGDWIYRAGDIRSSDPFHQLAGSSVLSQIHATVSLEILGLRPDASIGLSSGETNAMFAFGLWRGFKRLLDDVQDSGLYSRALAGDFEAVRTHWGLAPGEAIAWDNLRVCAPVGAVKMAVAAEPRVYLTIVNSPNDCVIGGDREACRRVLVALGGPPAVPLGHDLAVHCVAVSPFETIWRATHTRPTASPPPNIRFYSNALGGAYEPSEASVAEALTGQALRTVDFPMIIEQAWADGARIFVEHGPRGSLSTAISEILGQREHLAVALDRANVDSQQQVWRTAAQLWCAGVAVDLDTLCAETAPQMSPPAPAPPLVSFRLKPEGGDLPSLPAIVESSAAKNFVRATGRVLPRAPTLAPAAHSLALARLKPAGERPAAPVAASSSLSTVAPVCAPAPALAPAPISAPAVFEPAAAVGREGLMAAAHQRLSQAHVTYLRTQGQAMQEYIGTLSRLQQLFATGELSASPSPLPHDGTLSISPAPDPIAAPPTERSPVFPTSTSAAGVRVLPGPKFDRAQLEILAGGRISSVFGPSFAGQDGYVVQVRMPEPPLLLCDRVLGIEGEHHSMGKGTIWTATDVQADKWYMYHGCMSPGVLIECGQADLLLISWLGVDTFNAGQRAYRLLGCQLTFEGELPQPGDTLEYEIHIDGHARQGDVRLFFFHYDCRIGGDLRIAVRNGQAGFFTKAEMEQSSGVIWTPGAADYTKSGRVDSGPSPTKKRRFSRAEVQAYLDGNLTVCFGPAFFWASTHTRTPGTPADHRNFLGEVTDLDFAGGPAGRGYMRVETEVRGDEWFFAGHFKNDPCMPGTLMAEACLQAMAFYMAAGGHTLHRDGWRFEPVRGEPYTFLCRGQVTPESRRIVYELFVDETVSADVPLLRGHVLCTADGRKAFLCERLALQLVPDWPLSSMPGVLSSAAGSDPRPLAKIGDFPLDYASLINCAWGRPTHAFGERFAHYEGPTRSPRLPGPPYHFITRIAELSGEIMSMRPGGRVIALYDIPANAWYFGENGAATMPNCVLMEVALQPCGWLASYTLRRQPGAPELLFRNLDGDAIQHREVRPGDRAVTTEVEMLSLDRVGDLIIEKFNVRCTVDGEPLLDAETVFGFFPPQAMADQKGYGCDEAGRGVASGETISLTSRPERLFARSARLPDSKLLMIDRITGFWPTGGSNGLGLIRGEKDVAATDWFFKAHFFQDPVQPGSLGVEAMLQLMQALMLLESMDEGRADLRFEPLAIGLRAEWHYRGQVTPDRQCVAVEFEVQERGRDAAGPFVVGRATLSVDGLQIYQAPHLGMRLVKARPADPRQSCEVIWRLDSEGDAAWVKDHRPTYSVPALPFTYGLEMAAAAAAALFPGQQLVDIANAGAHRWITFEDAVAEGRTQVVATGPSSAQITIQVQRAGKLVTAFTAEVLFGIVRPAEDVQRLAPLRDARAVDDLYRTTLFHGPALQLMHGLKQASNGASAILDGARSGLPVGLLHPGLLDAALHCIPHDDPILWSPDLPPGLVGYPVAVENLRLFGDLAAGGSLVVEARLVDVQASRLMRTHIRLLREGVLTAMFDIVEALLPKGPLGRAPPLARRAFLAERLYAPGVALSQVGDGVTTLTRQVCADSDWLPGSLADIYALEPGVDTASSIALRDHAASQLRIHPRDVRIGPDGQCRNLPLNPWRLKLEDQGAAVAVRSDQMDELDWRWLRASWAADEVAVQGFVQDLGIVLVQRFVRRVILIDPDGFEALVGRPVLYLGNHQTGVESSVFLSIVIALACLPAGAIAKEEHRDSWVGRLHRLAQEETGTASRLKLWLFNRSQPEALLRLLQAYGEELAQRPSSLLVHTDGTRALQAGAPVGAVSAVLIDLALAYDTPIVPVRFVGGLPLDLTSQRLEFPTGAGQQDYMIGAAIDPNTLRAMPFRERSAFVRDRINALGPRGRDDAPLGGDPAFAAAVAAGRASGLNEVQSHLRAALTAFPGLSGQSARLLRDPSADPSALVATFAPLLIGEELIGAVG
jgi:acyl transferase domain-containing protein/3-hydroxymyristoyl/3-hydroxydecanoyl-(acyl carrier protein) dehydratase